MKKLELVFNGLLLKPLTLTLSFGAQTNWMANSMSSFVGCRMLSMYFSSSSFSASFLA